jgi:hypothetical protein
VVLAFAWPVRAGWTVLLGWLGKEPSAGGAAALVLALDCGDAYLVWTLRQLLVRRYGFHGADRSSLAVVGVLLLDAAAELYIILSGAPGFQVYSYQGPFTVILAYPMFQLFALAIALMAFGYSLLRFADDLYGVLRSYAYAQIAMGIALASLTLAILAVVPALVGHLLLAVLLLRVAAERKWSGKG